MCCCCRRCFGIDWSARDKEHLGEEISDVLIYLVRLADKCDVNLPAALNDKIAKNAQKYPAELVRACACMGRFGVVLWTKWLTACAFLCGGNCRSEGRQRSTMSTNGCVYRRSGHCNK